MEEKKFNIKKALSASYQQPLCPDCLDSSQLAKMAAEVKKMAKA